jgi:hypothetical protein
MQKKGIKLGALNILEDLFYLVQFRRSLLFLLNKFSLGTQKSIF